jgi:signal transduction histidine kinase
VGSLRSKVLIGYLFVVALLTGLAVFGFVQLEKIDRANETLRSTSQFLDLAQEIRNLEKNLALNRKQADYQEARQQLDRAAALLDERRDAFIRMASDQRVDTLRTSVADHDRLLAEYWQALRTRAAKAKTLEDSVQESRSGIFAEAEQMAATAVAEVDRALRHHRLSLVVSVGLLGVILYGAGKLLSRQVAQPLRIMEEKMQAVARGEIRAIDLGSSDREIRSLSAAFNRMLDELNARQREMVRSEKLASLGTMLSGVAHELNNPLSNISTSTQILAEELGQADPAYQRELVEQIDSETDRARQILRALLDFAPERAFRRESVPLQPLLQDTLRLFAGQVPENVRVSLNVAEDITVDADRPRLQQVFLNLFRNAVEAMPAGGELTVQASLAAADSAQPGRRRPGDGVAAGRRVVEIEVRDTGSGIAPQVLSRIFDPFFSTKEVGKGSGLGLFVAHQIVTEHGGSIAAESPRGQGTRFLVRLPAGAPLEEAAK